jgi:hypothetical protein
LVGLPPYITLPKCRKRRRIGRAQASRSERMRRLGAVEACARECSCSCVHVAPHQARIKLQRRRSNPRMPKITGKSAAKRAIRPHSAGFCRLPEWNLDDLYSGLNDPAIKRDLDRADAECAAFEETYKGKLAGLAAADGGAAL